MTKYNFRFNNSIKYLISINEMYILDTNENLLLKERYIERPKPFAWAKTSDSFIIDNDNKKLATIKGKGIYVDDDEWKVEQTKENDYSLSEQINPERENSEIEFPELGQWRLSNMARYVLFDGAKFIDNELIVKGSVALFPNSKFLFDTYCELESNSPNDHLIFAFLIFILHRYADYKLMGHNIWTV